MMMLNCPYCGQHTFSGNVERRPFQIIERCENCLQYSVRSTKSGTRYPLSNPEDATSPPHTTRR